MKKRKILPLILCGFALTSCGVKVSTSGANSSNSISNESILSETSVEQGNTSQNSSLGNSSITSSDNSGYLPLINEDKDNFNDVLTFSDLFDLSNKVEVSLDIEKTELDKIQADYLTELKNETYHHCKSVTIKITKSGNTYTSTYYDVGIRQKGNTSRDDIYDESGNLNLNHYKLSFDETFDDASLYGSEAYDWSSNTSLKTKREDRNVLGLSGLDIKWNKNYDSTHIKEVYASKIYEANGIISQHIGLTTLSLKVNDKETSFGLCTLYEPASKSLIKRALQSGKSYINMDTWKKEKAGTYGIAGVNYGDLYKASYGKGDGSSSSGADFSNYSVSGSRVGVGNSSGSYIPAYERKTNTDVTYDDAALKNLVSIVNSGNYENIASKIDTEYLAMVEACNYIIGNPDDLRNNNNNYMIYIRRTDGKAIIIPIDNDRCFGITKDYNPDGHAMMEMSVMTTSKAGGGDVNALLKNTTLSSSDNDAKTKYQEDVKAIRNSDFVKNETFESLYNLAKDTYGDASCTSPLDANLPGFTLEDKENKSFSDYINAKISLIDNYFGVTPTDGNYGDIYLNGSFVDWNAGTNYKFTYNGDGNYSITFTPSKVDSSNQIKCKIYDGNDYSRIDWAVDNDGNLAMDGKNYSSFVIDNVTTSTSVTINLNTLTKTIEFVKA